MVSHVTTTTIWTRLTPFQKGEHLRQLQALQFSCMKSAFGLFQKRSVFDQRNHTGIQDYGF
jgi:hypothetical protein